MCKHKHQVVQFLRFCIVGLGNTALDFTAFSLLTWGGVSYLLAQVLAYAIGVVNSFCLNHKWAFQMSCHPDSLEITKFMLLNGLSLLVSSGLLFILHDVHQLTLWLSKLIATGCAILVNFMGSLLWVFTKKPKKPFVIFPS